MQLDTRAAVLLVLKCTYQKHFQDVYLSPFKGRLTTYNGDAIKDLWCVVVDIKYSDKQTKLPLVVVDGDGPSLFGRNWLKHIRLDWYRIGSVGAATLKDVLAKFPKYSIVVWACTAGLWRSYTSTPQLVLVFSKPDLYHMLLNVMCKRLSKTT